MPVDMSGERCSSDTPQSGSNETTKQPRNELVDLVAPMWSEMRTRQALGDASSAALAEQRREGRLLGLTAIDSDRVAYPTFQFERHQGEVRVKPGLVAFMSLLAYRDPWSVAIVVKTPAPELDGLTPLDWVRQGRSERTLCDYARRLVAEFERR